MTETAVAKIVASATGGAITGVPPQVASDPFVTGLIWVVVLVFLLIAIAKPVRDYLRADKRDSNDIKADEAKTNAEKVLYEHLSEQVREYRTIADTAYTERNELFSKVHSLETLVGEMTVTKEANANMRGRLDRKDEEIQSLIWEAAEERKTFLEILMKKDTEITKRDQRIAVLEQRVHELEIRLATDESKMTHFNCPYNPSLQRRSGDVKPDCQEAV